MNPFTELNICVIGCGWLATGYHGPALRLYANTHPKAVLAGCCDLDLQKARDFQGRFGFCAAWSDYRAMLEAVKPNVVCLFIQPCDMARVGIEIMQSGCALLLEKPPGETVAETDRLITAARESSTRNRVAFNRRYMPLMRELKKLLDMRPLPGQIQHIRYDFSRVNRTDADFSTTAIHGIDAVRFLAGGDYVSARFHYQPLPDIGPTVANFFIDAKLHGGVTAHLNFCPMAGVAVERVTVHAHNHTYFLHLPVWNAFDTPGKLQHLVSDKLVLDVDGIQVAACGDEFVTNGFYEESASFFDDLIAGRSSKGDLASSRQSVEIAQSIRERKVEYHCSAAHETIKE